MRKFIYALNIILLYNNLFCQIDSTKIKSSNFEGRHFIVGFPQNEIMIDPRTGLVLRVYMTTNSDANITVQYTDSKQKNYSLSQNSVLWVDFQDTMQSDQSEQTLRKSIEINSDVPICVYCFSSQALTGDAYTAIPVTNWGTQYVCMSYFNDQYMLPSYQIPPEDSAYDLEPRQSEFMIMAAYDSTIISFQPTAITENGKQDYLTYNVSLNKGDCYLVKSVRSQRGTSDLSGTIVNGNKPFGFLSGHVRTAIPQGLQPDYDSKNFIVEMLTPTNAWGKHFITIPISPNLNGDMIRIANIKPNTTVTYSTFSGITKQVTLYDPGSIATIMHLAEPTVWLSDQPVQICQYMSHSGDSFDDYNYDPSMVLTPPIEEYVSKILFQVPGNLFNVGNDPQFVGHEAALIVDTAAIPTLKIDNNYVNDIINLKQNSILGTRYCYGYLSLNPGIHHLSSSKGYFSGVLFGFGHADAYSLTLGTSMNNPYRNDTIPPVLSFKEDCGIINGYVHDVIDSNTSGLDYALVDKKKTFNYQWNIDQISDTTTAISFTAQPIDITKDGKFVINFLDKNGNSTGYSFDYHGLKVTLPDSLFFKKVDWYDSLCYSFYIKNFGKDTVNLLNIIDTTNDTRLRYFTGLNFPYTLKSGDSIKVMICFDPRGDTSNLYSLLSVEFDCDRVINIPIECSVMMVELEAVGYDFGRVRVGDTVCAFAVIYNKGNSLIRIDSLSFPFPDNQFSIDTTGLLPSSLEPGDSLVIPVCFYPDSVGYYEITCTGYNGLTYGNSLYKTVKFKLKGTGVAPNVGSLVIDWGKRRISTRSDTTIFLVNNGSDTCNISVTGIVCPIDVFNTVNNLNFNAKLNINDSLKLSFGFEPIDTIAYSAVANYKVDWKFHKPVSITLAGIGTLPTIKTYDVDFGDVVINQKKDSTALIIESGGNEILTIDSVYYFSGDNNEFSIKSGSFPLKNLKLTPGSLFTGLTTFKPKTVGPHQVIYEVLNDATPGYGRAKAYIKLTGFGLPSDTLDAIISIEAPDQFISCQTTRIYAVLKNTGNVPLLLRSLILGVAGLTANWSQGNPTLGWINPNEIQKFPIDVFTINSTDGSIEVTAKFNDTLVRKIDFRIKPTSYPVIISNISDIGASPGDTVVLQIDGKFPYRIEKSIDFEIILSVLQKNLLLTTKNSYLVLSENINQRNYSLNCVQQPDKIVITNDEKLTNIGDSTSWSLKLRFLVLLSDELKPDLNFSIIPDDCYQENSKPGLVEIKGVCAFDIRNIQLIANKANYSITPNPVSENLVLDAFLPQDEAVNLKIFDKIGNICYDYKNLSLKKGTQKVIFEICNLADGVYILYIQSPDEIKSLKFIISK